MNYGKKNASKRQREITGKSAPKKKRAGVRIFKAIILSILLLCVIGVACGGIFLKKIIDDSPEVTPATVRPSGYTTFVYTQDGTELESLVAAGANRIYKTIDQIPEDLQHAFVAIEDERFYDHNGIDLQGILRAGIVGLTSGNFSEGASTLTQQLIKNNVFPNFLEEKTFLDRAERKLQEQYLAVQIEKQMDKQSILELYLNTINLGQSTLGVQAASKRYFDKEVNDLTLAESAVIAAITQNPTGYDPVINPEDNARRQKKVLGNMLAQGYITQEEHDAALAEPVYDQIQAVNAAVKEDISPYSYFVDSLIEQVINDLTDPEGLNYTPTQAYNALYSGGLSIYATQNLGMQQICDEEFSDQSNYPYRTGIGLDYRLTITRADGTVENFGSETMRQYLVDTTGDKYPLVFSSDDEVLEALNTYKAALNIQEGDTVDEKITLTPQPQASVVIMDQSTGEVKAMVGGRGSKEDSLSLNRATDSTRQPGSCFKILSTYAPALDSAGLTLANVEVDEKYYYNDIKHTQVKNWWGDYYKGPVTMREAIEQSMNVIAVKTLTKITPQVGYNYLENFGFTTLTPEDINQPTALGGITRGITNIEMTAAYAAIANKGVYQEPILYTKILDHDGNVLIDRTPKTRTVLQESTAALLTNAMEDVITGANGTGRKAQLTNMPVSGKTGTTNDNVDIWFSGYTPYLTCSVWGGYDSNMPLEDYETTWHLTLWQSIMERIHANAEKRNFDMPSSIEQKYVCKLTGKLAVTGSCPGYMEYFAPGTAPTQSCAGHGYSGSSSGNSSGSSSGSSENNNSNENGENSSGENSGGVNGQTGGETGGGETGGGTGGETGGETGGGQTGGETGGGQTGGGETGGEADPTVPTE